MTTLVIDLGNTTGIVFIGKTGELLWDRQMTHDDFVDMLAGLESLPASWSLALRTVDLVVVEDFKLLPGKARAVSQKTSRTVDAARGIGAADLWARQRGIELIYRDPSHWRIGLQLAGIEPARWPKNHSEGHSMCAYGAGFHALVELGLVQTRLGTLQ